MDKATQLMKALTNNFKKPLNKKYSKVVLKVATIEERIKIFKELGMLDRAKKFSDSLTIVVRKIRLEFKKEKKD